MTENHLHMQYRSYILFLMNGIIDSMTKDFHIVWETSKDDLPEPISPPLWEATTGGVQPAVIIRLLQLGQSDSSSQNAKDQE